MILFICILPSLIIMIIIIFIIIIIIMIIIITEAVVERCLMMMLGGSIHHPHHLGSQRTTGALTHVIIVTSLIGSPRLTTYHQLAVPLNCNCWLRHLLCVIPTASECIVPGRRSCFHCGFSVVRGSKSFMGCLIW